MDKLRFRIGLVVPITFVLATSVSPTFANAAATQQPVKVGIVEELGHYIPLNLVFKDSEGHDVTLNRVADGKPLIIDMAYFECPGICDVVMGNLKNIIGEVSEVPGKDFNVATISFNPADMPMMAKEKTEQFVRSMSRPIPATAWRFLTGDSASIFRLTGALGFYFMRDKYGKFTHPTALIIVDKNGKIVRYIQGTTFALADVETALAEARTGVPEDIITSTPKVCFSHDPSGYKITDTVLRYGGLGTMIFVAGFLVFLRSKKKFGKGIAKIHDKREGYM